MKLTGASGAAPRFGALAAVTQQEIARTYDPATDQFDEMEVEPTSMYGVMRTPAAVRRVAVDCGAPALRHAPLFLR
jgi:hypothetical protein